GVKETKSYLLNQLEHTIISENPLSEDAAPAGSIVVGTVQKIIDSEIRAKYHFWLDISSSEWLKQDIGPLYNSWVFQKDWCGGEFDINDNIRLTQDKAGRVLRKLYLCNAQGGRIFAYSSVYDFAGIENFGGINRFLTDLPCGNLKESRKVFKITPRQDQKAVLDYTGGKMAVSAVAGSGKTTIMLALILKLLEGGVSAENIFVLTFMESAARNFKERIKENFLHINELPHISTIHGLALRILKENNNCALVGLDSDFEIIDEVKRTAFLSEIIFSYEMGPDAVELYDRAISAFKNDYDSSIKNVKNAAPKSALFKKIFSSYQGVLSLHNCIDYDDLLLLALKVLKTNEGARLYYQRCAKYVIEDEAQDSSALQQELLTLLSAGSGNIIRCGDVNQAITSTFSNSDTAGFKKFIEQNASTKMDRSERCSKGVYTLANSLIEEGKKHCPGAFLEIQMKPVLGKNPEWENELAARVFDTQEQERAFVLSEIRKIFAHSPNATVGLLLRSNWSVNGWAEYFEQNKIDTTVHTDALLNNPVFEIVLGVFNFILEPKNNEGIIRLYKTFTSQGFYADEPELVGFIQGLDKPFVLSEGQYFALWWDLNYFLGRSFLEPEELALEIGNFYSRAGQFENSDANSILVSLIVSKISKTTTAAANSFEALVARLNSAAGRASKFGIKFFDRKAQQERGGSVEIMTIHKAKGDEFDFVFVPELSAENMNLDADKIKLKKNSTFTEKLKTAPRTDEELRREIAQENYRLLYVAITRAKKSLTLSSALKYKFYNKLKGVEVCRFLKEITKGG
ncbi:DNA helicase II / ATP-dependent DNA helicase PcrA, partial [Candidatus Gastranaerophilus sp. (ex Termes propinquus)]